MVDDTWVSGGKGSVRSAGAEGGWGAAVVTVLCVARWLRYDWPDHRRLIESLEEPYNAGMCPVTGGACPTPGCPAVLILRQTCRSAAVPSDHEPESGPVNDLW